MPLQTYYSRDNAQRFTAAPTNAQRPRPPTPLRGPPRNGHLHRVRPPRDEIVFTRNASEAINLVARSFGAMRNHPAPAMRFLLTGMEHPTALVPWQLLAAR